MDSPRLYSRRFWLWLAVVFFCCLATQVLAGEKSVQPPVKADKSTKKGFSYEVVAVLATDEQGKALKLPSTVFFDRQTDELYLLNGGDNRFVIYGPDYFPQESLGKGRGIDSPVDGAMDSKGNILIPQRRGEKPPRITMLNSAFLPVGEISLAGIPEVNDFSPDRIALSSNNDIYLVGVSSPRVLSLKADGTFVKWLTVPVDSHGAYQSRLGDKTGRLAQIRNVAVDSQNNLYLLSEETSKTYVFDPEGNFLFAFGAKGGSEGKLSRPQALAIDEKRKCIYVVDYMRHTVLIYDFAGAFRFEFGGLGWGLGWFKYPVDIVIGRQGQVVIVDLFNQRAQVFAINLAEFPERQPALWHTGSQNQ